MTAPIAFRTIRYRCPHCIRTGSSKQRITEHMGRCWYNPAARGCMTCDNYIPTDDACGCEPGCNWGGPAGGYDEQCAAGISLAGQPALQFCPAHTDPDNPFGKPEADTCPDCRTDGKAVKPGPIVHCHAWELRKEAAA